MNQTQDRIIRVARKLFALAAKAGTQEEAHRAAMKARELLSEYSLTMSDVDMAQAEAEMKCREERQTLTTTYTPSWVKNLFCAVRRGFGCDGFLSSTLTATTQARSVIVFLGVEPDVSLASFTFEYLYRIGKRAPGMAGKKEKQKNQWRRGFAVALYSRLVQHEETPQEKALVPIKHTLIGQYKALRHPDLVPALPPAKIDRVTKAFQAGYAHGKAVPMHTPVAGAGGKPLAIGA